MIGKTIGLILIMTVTIVVLPIQVAMLVSRSHKYRGSTLFSNPAFAAQFCNNMADYEASNHSH